MVNCRILESGALLVTADNHAREFIAEELRNGRDYWGIWADLFEPYSTNGSYEPFDAGRANPFVGLTSAPCIAESMAVRDDGTREIEGRLWWFPDYCIRDPLDELKARGRTVFASGSDE